MKKLVLLGVCATLALAHTGSVFARSQAAWLGSSGDGRKSNCFVENGGGPVQNRCEWANWIMPIVYDNAGNKTIRVSAQGARGTAQRVFCRSYSNNSSGGGLRFGPRVNTVRHNGTTEYLKSRVNTHGFGGTWMSCRMEKGTRLFNVHY